MLKHIAKIGVVAAVMVALSACGGSNTRQMLGMKRNQPDEFRVVSRPALSVPPVYYLRPPTDDAVSGMAASERAEALVFSGQEPEYVAPGASDPNYFDLPETAVLSVGESTLPSSGEESFLRLAGAKDAQDNIRRLLDEENRPLIIEEKREKGFFERLRFGNSEEPVVDAAKERERILTNEAEGKPITEGEVPVVDPKQESTLEKIFK